MNEHGMRREVLGYDEFGASLYTSFRNQPFTFTGYQFDPVADTYFAQAREYNPQLGRFISQDTHWHPRNMIYGDYSFSINNRVQIPNALAMISSQNLYAYVMNNPNIHVDPDGEIPVLAVTMGVGALIGGAVSAGANIVAQTTLGGGWSNISWGEVGVSALSGAASGALAGSGVGIAGVVAGNAAISATSYVGTQMVNNEEITISGALINAGVGAGFGLAGGSGKATIQELSQWKHAMDWNTGMKSLSQSITGNNGSHALDASIEAFSSLFRNTVSREIITPGIFHGLRDEAIEFFLIDRLFEWAPLKNQLDRVNDLWGGDTCELEC